MTDEFIKMATEKCVKEIMALHNGESIFDELEWTWDNNPPNKLKQQQRKIK